MERFHVDQTLATKYWLSVCVCVCSCVQILLTLFQKFKCRLKPFFQNTVFLLCGCLDNLIESNQGLPAVEETDGLSVRNEEYRVVQDRETGCRSEMTPPLELEFCMLILTLLSSVVMSKQVL